MSSPRGLAAPGRAERRDGRRRSASIPWRRGRPVEAESERAREGVSPRGGGERAEAGEARWAAAGGARRVAAGGRARLDGPLGVCQVTAVPPQPFSRYNAPLALSLSCRPCRGGRRPRHESRSGFCCRGGRRRGQRLGDRAARGPSASRAPCASGEACTATGSRGGDARSCWFLERASKS
jgi:hypothetical protein